ncbi:MAG: PD40 domain-containing protein [Saprospiraceae bacterium]|nr:PD40 domain-containing protein [Saprospiraceae bacterium]
MKIRILSAIILFALINDKSFTQSKSELKSSLKNFLSQNKYKEASKIFDDLLSMKLSEKELLLAGETYLKNHQLDKAANVYSRLIALKSRKDQYKLKYAELLHHSNQFIEAAKAYKFYLKFIKKDARERIGIEQKILQALNGSRNIRLEKPALVEPLNNFINTEEDENSIFPSYHFQGKYYFSSNRSKTLEDNLSRHQSDIYSIEDSNGNWSIIKPLDKEINTTADEFILGFVEQGTGLIYLSKSNQTKKTEINLKYFNSTNYSKIIPFKLPFYNKEDSPDISIFQDSICIFSSQQEGGFGSYDLYITILRKGTWTVPVNLGSRINSPFDEVTPFIAKDGRTLYFSSNGLSSLGGFDVFRTEFLAEEAVWSVPMNLGIPVNSAGDEVQFKLNKNGLSGVFTSNRMDLGIGGDDVFIAYFKEEFKEQYYDEAGSVLSYIIDHKDNQPVSLLSVVVKDNDNLNNAKPILIDPLVSDIDDYVTADKNKAALAVILDLARKDTAYTLQCIGHSNESENVVINLFSSVKRAEELVAYLEKNGIENKRIQTIGVGASFVIASKNANGLMNQQEKIFNNRVEVNFQSDIKSRIDLEYHPIIVPELFKLNEAFEFQKIRNGVTYSVLIGESSQMLGKNLDNLKIKEFFCEYRNGKYYYYAGIASKFELIAELKSKSELPKNSIIHAFINGRYIEEASIINFAGKYPDLILLINYNKSKK